MPILRHRRPEGGCCLHRCGALLVCKERPKTTCELLDECCHAAGLQAHVTVGLGISKWLLAVCLNSCSRVTTGFSEMFTVRVGPAVCHRLYSRLPWHRRCTAQTDYIVFKYTTNESPVPDQPLISGTAECDHCVIPCCVSYATFACRT